MSIMDCGQMFQSELTIKLAIKLVYCGQSCESCNQLAAQTPVAGNPL